jgi:hypothetical protein
MELNERTEVREMISDIIGGPLEKINGKLQVMVQQLSNVEIQTLKTNGRVNELEIWQLDVIKQIALELPHHLEDCPQGPVLEGIKMDLGTIKTDVNTLKTAKSEKIKFQDSLRANIGTIVAIILLVISLTVNLTNHKQNATQITNQADIRKEIMAIMKEDSTISKSIK